MITNQTQQSIKAYVDVYGSDSRGTLYKITFPGMLSEHGPFTEADLNEMGLKVPETSVADKRAALNIIGYDDDAIAHIARDGAYWQDASPLVQSCREIVGP